MPNTWLESRITKNHGFRWRVCYRLGGRGTPVRRAGTFAREADAERARMQVAMQIAGREFGVAPVDTPKHDTGVVYIGEFLGLYKIGVSTDPERRCRELHLDLLHTEPGGRAREAELHRRFAKLRERGEFFRPGQGGEIRRYIRQQKALAEASRSGAAA